MWNRLVDQQFWLFGQDVVAAEGNRLLTYGGERLATMQRGKAACYRLPISPHSNAYLYLWGFGALHTVDGSAVAFLQRAAGKIKQPPVARQPAAYEHATAETFLKWKTATAQPGRLLRPIAQWIVAYECWIRDFYGAEARRDNVSSWDAFKKPTTNPDSIAEDWKQFVDPLDLSDDRFDAATRWGAATEVAVAV